MFLGCSMLKRKRWISGHTCLYFFFIRQHIHLRMRLCNFCYCPFHLMSFVLFCICVHFVIFSHWLLWFIARYSLSFYRICNKRYWRLSFFFHNGFCLKDERLFSYTHIWGLCVCQVSLELAISLFITMR